MRITGNFLMQQSTSIFNAYCVNQSVAQYSKNDGNENAILQRDSVQISPQGKAANMLESLMKQKTFLTDRKNELMASAAEKGTPMDAIQAQLDSYDEQIKTLDQQIAELMAQQMEKEAEKQSESKKEEPKTEQEIQNQRLADITDLSVQADQVEVTNSIKTKLDGRVGVLESELKLDKQRGASKEMIERKENEIAALKQRSNDLVQDMGDKMMDITEDIKQNNNTVQQPEEEESEEQSTEDTYMEQTQQIETTQAEQTDEDMLSMQNDTTEEDQ